jgi:glutaredoxin 3
MSAGNYDAAAVSSKMQDMIKDNPVVMLSLTTCPFCIKAKQVLDGKGVKYLVYELDQEEDGFAMRAEMAEMINRTSVPAIWLEGTFIGGLRGICKLNESGKLDGMLQQVGSL